MMRNIPKRCTRASITQLLDLAGFKGEYDLVYVPISRSTCSNLGFAFVNFCNVLASFRFACQFHGVPVKDLFPASGSDKILGVLHAALHIRAAYARLSQLWNVTAPTFPAVQQPLSASLLGGHDQFCTSPCVQLPWGGSHGYPGAACGFEGMLDSCSLPADPMADPKSRPCVPPSESPLMPDLAASMGVSASRGRPDSVYARLQEFVVGSTFDSDCCLRPSHVAAPTLCDPSELSSTPLGEEASCGLPEAHQLSWDVSLMKECTAMSSSSEISGNRSERSLASNAADEFSVDDEESDGEPGDLPCMDAGVHRFAASTDGLAGSCESAIDSPEEAGEASDHDTSPPNPVSRNSKDGASFGSREQKSSHGLAWFPRLLLILSGFTLGYVLPVQQHVSVSAKSVSALSFQGNREL
mmetsp:Transcript_30379/g.87004  ORF Transcript_30379/g.87004 Transcript_30379/m.87004 type:complete len:412 (-) Transcript_30379:73-1308(-)